MTYELSTNTVRGFNLAQSHAVMDEALNRRSGLPMLSEAGLTHGEQVAKLQYWVNQLDAAGSEAECYAMLCYLGAAFGGAAMARDDLDVAAGDEVSPAGVWLHRGEAA